MLLTAPYGSIMLYIAKIDPKTPVPKIIYYRIVVLIIFTVWDNSSNNWRCTRQAGLLAGNLPDLEQRTVSGFWVWGSLEFLLQRGVGLARPGSDLAADFMQIAHVQCGRKPAVWPR